ncbi:beta-phosphoglucomutase family hydrolase [Hymenobacter agri]
MKPALIFDMDGVLVDNTPVQARAFQLLFRDLGLTTNARQLLRRLNGMPAGDIIQSVFRHSIDKKQLDIYAEQREFLYRTLYWSQRQALPGLVEFLNAARAEGFKVGLGTGSGGPTLSYILDYLDLRQYFDVIIGKDDVPKGKPHPDTYSITAARLGVKPENCIVFEDALLGEQAAYRAGMRCVGVATSLPAKAFQNPLMVITDFTEINPGRLLQLLAQQPVAPKPQKRRG